MSTRLTHDSFKKQSGSTLIVTLIILILMMLLGVTAMSTSDTQSKLTGNLQFESLAMDNSEKAVKAGELWLDSVAATTPSASAVAALLDPLTGMSWTNSDSVQVTPDDSQRYAVAFVGVFPSPTAGLGIDCSDPLNPQKFDCVNTYLVTARGTSARGATKYVQTYYAEALK
jgi:Tfp pilus assembly protein PilX